MAHGHVLFVDLENVQKLELSRVPNSARVMVFYGTTQKKLPEDLVVQAQPLGERLSWIKISGQGPNALDFHIAFYLGRELTDRPKSDCSILSRDTGFDPLVRHLGTLGYACRRVTALKDAFPPQEGVAAEPFNRLLGLLRKEKTHPLKLKGLQGKVKSWFPQLDELERRALVQKLFSDSYVREAGPSLAYYLTRDKA